MAHCTWQRGLNFLMSAKQFWSLKNLRVHKSKIHWRSEHENFVIQMKKIKQENLGLLLVSKYVPVDIRWSHKTTICVSKFVASKIMPLSSWFITGHKRLNDSKTQFLGALVKGFFLALDYSLAKAAALPLLKTWLRIGRSCCPGSIWLWDRFS